MLSFYGQQEDEVVLYEIRPAWSRKLLGALVSIFYTVAGIAATTLYTSLISGDTRYAFTAGIIISLIIGGVAYGWFRFTTNRARAFITDRRFVRLEISFPAFISRRSLFWSEVLKVKGYAPNILFRSLKVGTLAIQPVMSESGKEDVKVSHVYYYGDLANYIDKILYTFKAKPEEVKEIRPFVPRPAGERF